MDYSQYFEQIIQVFSTPSKVQILGLIFPPIAILLSGFLGFYASHRSIRKNLELKEQKEKNRKVLMLHMLEDEISKRWFDMIEKDLSGLKKRDNNYSFEVFSKTKLDKSDLLVLRTISEGLPHYDGIGGHDFISKVVHGYLLYIDLIDYQRTFNDKFLTIKSFGNPYADKELCDYWGKLDSKVGALSERLQSILDEIGSESEQKI